MVAARSSKTGGSWKIEKMVPPDSKREWGEYSRFPDAAFKRDLTMRLKGTLTRCTVPPGCSLPGWGDVSVPLELGDAFVFAIERCHLTQPGAMDRTDIRAMDVEQPFDIAAELRLRGVIVVDRFTKRPIVEVPVADRTMVREVISEIPARWITDWYEWSSEDKVHRWTAMPQWSV